MNENGIFAIPMHVRPLEDSIMPQELKGAYVICYVGAQDYVDAATIALHQLSEDGLHPEEILQPIHEIHLNDWMEHLRERWPDFIDHFPGQDDVEEVMRTGAVIYSPFASYDAG